jgi:hypothetical protein
VDFPDYTTDELHAIAGLMLDKLDYRLSPAADATLLEYIERRRARPNFANARSIRNALDRARLRQANRLYGQRGTPLNRDALMTIEPEDLRASRVFDLPDPPTEVTS